MINLWVIEFVLMENEIWVGIVGGFFYWDYKSGMIVGFDKWYGLVDNVIKIILVDYFN